MTFPPARFDLVLSVLALHYVDDYPSVVARISKWLTRGGGVVLSTEHPIFTARLPDDGWLCDDAGRTRWALNDYTTEGPRDEVHRTLATMLNGLAEAGLTIERGVEPIPSAEWLERHPSMRDERRRPMFLPVRARKS